MKRWARGGRTGVTPIRDRPCRVTRVAARGWVLQRMDRLDGFDLQDQARFDDDVGDQSAIDRFAFVNDRETLLPGENQTGPGEFAAEAGFIDRFQQARAEFAVDLDRATDHGARVRV